MAPKPILKATLPSFTRRSSTSSVSINALPFASCRNLLSPHVHFPPTPTIASTQTTHSSSTYDRAPISVSPNSCELPERGERVYSPSCVSQHEANDYFDPLSFNTCAGTAPSSDIVPPLIPDTSESEESDEYGSPLISPPNIPFSPTRPSLCSMPSPFSQAEFAYALSFLPHPSSSLMMNDDDDRASSPVMDNNPRTPPLLKKGRKGCERPRLKRRYSAFDEQSLNGCLGGF